MSSHSVGFVGGGRVTRILLSGLERAGKSPTRCVVGDTDRNVLDALRSRFPGVEAVAGDVAEPVRQDIVFGALHPPVMKEALPHIGRQLRPEAIFVSLAPVIRIQALTNALGGFERVARMIPNAASIVGSGFNPVAFATGLDPEAKSDLIDWLSVLGECPEVPDEQLEAYAILTAMGPTYFWYQFAELEKIGTGFGLDGETTRHALTRMLHGGVKTFFESGLRPDEVIDLIPVKPLESAEKQTCETYRTQLRGLYDKLTRQPTGVGQS
jgi:pyrroline-5-carboxylate reductase